MLNFQAFLGFPGAFLSFYAYLLDFQAFLRLPELVYEEKSQLLDIVSQFSKLFNTCLQIWSHFLDELAAESNCQGFQTILLGSKTFWAFFDSFNSYFQTFHAFNDSPIRLSKIFCEYFFSALP